MKRSIALVQVEMQKDGLYAGEDADVFLSNLHEWVEAQNKTFVYARFSVRTPPFKYPKNTVLNDEVRE